MDRRNFVKTSAAGIAVAATPGAAVAGEAALAVRAMGAALAAQAVVAAVAAVAVFAEHAAAAVPAALDLETGRVLIRLAVEALQLTERPLEVFGVHGVRV